ncbi:MAG TPA: hypothetical protein PK280_03385 [Planctomycetota bacterium]|nr:hypothetical protein [Planctomycetota bacterium]
MRTALICVIVWSAGLATQAGEGPAFVAKPSVSSEAGVARITFEASAPTDVAVEVLDKDGRIVRHLGAGVLGANAPEPFRKGTLAQSVVWDRRDDAGKPVTGPCTARVRLGLRAGFDRFIGPDAAALANWVSPAGLAVDSKGNLLVLGSSGAAPLAARTENCLIAISREGKYLKRLYPFSAKTATDKLRGVDLLSSQPGRIEPRVYEQVCTAFLPQFQALARQTVAITADDRLVIASGWATELYGFGPRGLMVLNADGSVPRERVDGPVLLQGCNSGYLHMAAHPDGKSVYVCGLGTGREYSPGKLHHVVYRVGLEPDAKPEVAFGELNKAGGDDKHLNDPRGIAVGPKGEVYVSDFGNNRIVVLAPDGARQREIKVEGPAVLAVHPGNGAIYVHSMPAGGGHKLLKLEGDAKPVWELTLPSGGKRDGVMTHPVIALDWRAPAPIVYLGFSDYFARCCVLRAVDRGDKCESSDMLPAPKGNGWITGMAGVDAEGRLYAKQVAAGNNNASSCILDPDGASAKGWWAKYYDNVVLGGDGLVYSYKMGKSESSETLARVTVDKRPAPFSASGEFTEVFPRDLWPGRRDSIYVRPSGDIYLLSYLERGGKETGVFHLTPDGRFDKKLLGSLPAPASVKVDSRGNIFIADNLKPVGQHWPAEINDFVSKLDKPGQAQYAEIYGAVLKFGPAGGTVKRLAKGAAPSGDGKARVMDACQGEWKFEVEGLLASYVGVSPRPPPRLERSKCWCLSSSLDMDRHDRLFVPDSARFRVHVLDSNLNLILDFGGYDNADAPGGAANAPGPEIPMECPLSVRASDTAAYVLDAAPCTPRVVRVKLSYAAEETCALP